MIRRALPADAAALAQLAERNPRAIAFYRRIGFVEQGEQRFLLGTDLQRDLVLARPLDRPLLPRHSGDAA
jgi:ribosomal protein S18 acetylase RimI-like enzyme